MDGRSRIFEVGDDDLQEDSVWADVDSESGDDEAINVDWNSESGLGHQYEGTLDDSVTSPGFTLTCIRSSEEDELEQLLAKTRANQIKPFKSKLNKIYSLFLMIALVIILAYLDYVNDFQIKKLISNFQITPKSNWADAKAMCSRNSVKQVDAVVYFVQKDKTDLQCISDVDSNRMEREKMNCKSSLHSLFHKNVTKKEKGRSS